MEENEGKSKIPVKPIVAGLFILAAVSALAYAGYVYHRNSQRDEALAWARQSIELRSKFDFNFPSNEYTKHFSTTMKMDGACSIQLVYLSGFRLSGNGMDDYTTCGLNLGWLSPSAVKVSKDAESTRDPVFIDIVGNSLEGTWAIWLTTSPPKELKCTTHMVTANDVIPVGPFLDARLPIFMQDEEGADRTASALKTAIRLCGGKDEPF